MFITLPVTNGYFSKLPQHNDLIYCQSFMAHLNVIENLSVLVAAMWWQRLGSLETVLPSLTHELESAISVCLWPLDEARLAPGTVTLAWSASLGGCLTSEHGAT